MYYLNVLSAKVTACGNFFMKTGTFLRYTPRGSRNYSKGQYAYYSFDGTKLVEEKSYFETKDFFALHAVNAESTTITRSIDEVTPNGDQLILAREYTFRPYWIQQSQQEFDDPSQDFILLEHFSDGELVWSHELVQGASYTFEEFILIGNRHFLLGTENDITYLIDLDCLSGSTPPEPTTCDVHVNSSNGGVTITGLPIEANTKLFDSNFSSLFECNPWFGNPCNGTETVSGLNASGTYYLSVQSDICDEWIPINSSDAGNNILFRKTDMSLQEFENSNLYPNPSSDEVYIRTESSYTGKLVMEIYDVVGSLKSSKIMDLEIGTNIFELATDQLAQGTYNIILRNENNEVKQTRFVRL